ncbi:hypothetical protein [Nonomuraea candida]|uniref:hypothetical protein n=1 Tax=Nonomuraea candida TaxID=359159 RepID=UPI0005BDFD59|nr:hypothetical protein [Nonomuraea candida]
MLAAALPPPSAYGAGVEPWTGRGDRLDLTCSPSLFLAPLPAAVPVVSRSLVGPVTVHEQVVVMPDEERAERARRLLTTPPAGLRDEITGRELVRPCGDREEGGDSDVVRLPYRKEPFSRGGWTGETESLAVRRAKAPADATYRDSVAHVALVVRRGATVARLIWQGPAGTDLAAAVRAGRAALTRTLDRLPG